MKQIIIDIKQLNEERMDYLKKVFTDPSFEQDNLYYLYCYLQHLKDCEIIIDNNEVMSDYTALIIRIFNEVYNEFHNYELEYLMDEGKTKTVILDTKILNEQGHKYLKEIFNFPDYYGENLDALYDCLSEKDNLEIMIVNDEEANESSLDILGVIDDVSLEYGNITVTYIDEDAEEKQEE